MWERHTLAAKEVYWRADKWARANGWREIPVDLLLHVMLEDEECRGVRLLALAGIDHAGLKKLAVYPEKGEPVPAEEECYLGDDARERILRSYEIAVKELGLEQIGTEHLLLALLERPGWVDSPVLTGINLREKMAAV